MEKLTRQEIAKNLRQLREQVGLTQTQVGAILGRNQQSVNHWETGYSQPNIETLLQMFEIYGIDSVFSPSQRYNRQLSREEQVLLTAYQKAPDAIQAAVRRLLDLREGEPKVVPFQRELPLYDLPASAGTGLFLDSSDYKMVSVGEEVPLRANFGVRLKGDSMSPLYRDGQVVWVRQQPQVASGEIGIFLLNGSVYCKRLFQQGRQLLLRSVNAKYQPIQVGPADELRTVGRVL